MARKTKHKSNAFRLDDAVALLKQIEVETLNSAEKSLGNDWEENLFELFMTRMEISEEHREKLSSITSMLREEPKQAPRFARRLLKTMHTMLKHAGAPSSPPHVLAMSGLYTLTIDAFLQDDTKDLSKTMAAVDKQIKQFVKFCGFMPCSKLKQAA